MILSRRRLWLVLFVGLALAGVVVGYFIAFLMLATCFGLKARPGTNDLVIGHAIQLVGVLVGCIGGTFAAYSIRKQFRD